MKNKLDVIAWKISFKEKGNKFVKYEKDLLKFLLKRFFSGRTIFEVQELEIFPHNKFNKEQDLHKILCDFYIK